MRLWSSRLLLGGHLEHAPTAERDAAWLQPGGWDCCFSSHTPAFFCVTPFKKNYSAFIYSLFFSSKPQVFRFWSKDYNMRP